MQQPQSATRSPQEMAKLFGDEYLINYTLDQSENILRDTWWMVNALKAYRDNTDFIVKDMDIVLSHAMALGNKDIIQLALWSGGRINQPTHPGLGFKIPEDWKMSSDLNDIPKTEEDEILHASLYFHNQLQDLAQDGKISTEDANALIDLAIYTNTSKYFDLVMNFNPNLNAVDENGKTFLHHTYDNNIFTEKLLQNGANPNIQDDTGRTPIMYAMLNGNADVMETLIKNGADLTIKDNNGLTAADYIKTTDVLFAYQKLVPAHQNETKKTIVKNNLTQDLKDIATPIELLPEISNNAQQDRNSR